MSLNPSSDIFTTASPSAGETEFGGEKEQQFRTSETRARRIAGPAGELSGAGFLHGNDVQFRYSGNLDAQGRSPGRESRAPLPDSPAEDPSQGADDAPGSEPEPDMLIERTRAAFALWVLGDETGLGIFRLLSEHSPDTLSPVIISRELNLPPRATAQQLSKLRRAGLIHDVGSGRRKTYRADNNLVRHCLSLIHELTAVLHPA